jgi:hypothetical protein
MLRLTALVLTLALSVPAAALILRTMGVTSPEDAGRPRRRQVLEGAFALAPVVLLAVLIAFSVARA